MPGMDSTGPLGSGPIGRELGPCGGDLDNPGRGRGFGRGRGAGWNRVIPAISPDEQKKFLSLQKERVQSQLAEIEKRLSQLEESKESVEK